MKYFSVLFSAYTSIVGLLLWDWCPVSAVAVSVSWSWLLLVAVVVGRG